VPRPSLLGRESHHGLDPNHGPYSRLFAFPRSPLRLDFDGTAGLLKRLPEDRPRSTTRHFRLAPVATEGDEVQLLAVMKSAQSPGHCGRVTPELIRFCGVAGVSLPP